MKTKLLRLIVITITIIGFAGCARNIQDKRNDEKNEINVTLSVKEESITNNGATFILNNNSSDGYYYGPEYFIEKYENDSYKQITLDEPLSWTTTINTLDAGQKIEFNVDFTIGYGLLENGKYRLVKKIRNQENDTSTQTEYIALYSEFEIK